jgi:hypothetical protein
MSIYFFHPFKIRTKIETITGKEKWFLEKAA